MTANVHLLPQVIKLVNDLDARTAQVLIDAKIVEVASDFRDRLGVRWSPIGSQVYDKDDLDNSVLIKTSGAYKTVFGGKSGVLDTTVSLDFLIQFLRK